jgi:hypothetical protein
MGECWRSLKQAVQKTCGRSRISERTQTYQPVGLWGRVKLTRNVDIVPLDPLQRLSPNCEDWRRPHTQSSLTALGTEGIEWMFERHTCELSFGTLFCALHLTKTCMDVGDPEVDRVPELSCW